MAMDYDEDSEKESAAEALRANQLRDFDCPSCNANNPCDPPAIDGSELLCNYCGTEYLVRILDGKVKFKEV